MRILFVVQPTDGGAPRCVADLVRAAVAGGIEATVVSPSGDGFPDEVMSAGAKWVRLEMTRSPSLRDFWFVLRLRFLMRNIDLIHLHSSKAGALGRLAALGFRPRPAIVFTPHGWSWLADPRRASLYVRLERLLGRVSDVAVACSRGEQITGGEALRGTGAELRVIANGVDPNRFTPDGETAERGDSPLLVCVGRLAHEKGQDVLIRALRLLDQTDAIVRLVGDGPAREGLEALARDLGVDERVEFLGKIDDPRPHVRAADVIVTPSRYEGLQLGLLEAMACARPIVATDVSGTEVLPHGVQIVPPNDAELLAAAISWTLANRPAAEMTAVTAREIVMTDLTLDTYLQSHLALWHELHLERSRAGRATRSEKHRPAEGRQPPAGGNSG